ncbi:MAG: helix-turn-helix transcriptional regulator [Desulfamplus sp.]|nr:helix-turn-helix transcriptional regulator [Desulfamplus sp.]
MTRGCNPVSKRWVKISYLDNSQKAYVGALEIFLKKIVSPFSRTLHTVYKELTISEIKVANLIREGKTTKEIAVLLDSSQRAIDYHRQNLRKKLGLNNRKANLASHLLSLRE